MARAARLVRLKASGTGAAVTGEACTNLGNNKTYRVTNAARRVWDASAAVTVKVGGVATAEVYELNRLAGTITFAVADAGRAAVTVDMTYLPMTAVAKVREFALSFVAANTDTTNLDDSADVVRQQAQCDCSGSLSRLEWDTYFSDALDAGTVFVLEMSPDGGTTVESRLRLVLSKDDVEGAVGDMQKKSVEFEGVGDADGRSFTFANL